MQDTQQQTGGTVAEPIVNTVEPIVENPTPAVVPAAETVQPESSQAAPTPEVAPVVPAKRDNSELFLDPELVASLDVIEEPHPAVAALPPTPDPAAAAVEQPSAPVAPVVEAPPTLEQPAAVAPQAGWPTLTPESGKDAWGNIIHNGVPVSIFRNPDGTVATYEADPQTGLIKFSDQELQELKVKDPDAYLAYHQERNTRLQRVAQVFQNQQKSEVATVQQKLAENGMPAQVLNKVHAKALQMLQQYGDAGYAPGAYSQAVVGATSEILLYDKDAQLELARAIIASHEGAQPKPAAPAAPVAATPAAAPEPARPVRLAAGGIASASGAPPARSNQPTNAIQMSDADRQEMTRLGLSAEDFANFSEGVSISA